MMLPSAVLVLGALVSRHSMPRRDVMLAGASVVTAPHAWAADRLNTPRGRYSSLQDATVVVTAGHQGLGFDTAARLAAQGARVIITARQQRQTDKAVSRLAASASGSGRIVGIPLDLANLTEIRGFPERLQATLGEVEPAVDVLISCAQGASPFNSQREQTSDGFERTMGVSVLGHHALVCALLPALRRAPRGFRVISVSSTLHRAVMPGEIYYALEDNLRLDAATTLPLERYKLTKVATVLYTVELQRRLREAGLRGSAVVVGLHDPRIDLIVDESLAAELNVKLAAAADTGEDRGRQGATYFSSESGESEVPSAAATDPRYAVRLWALTEKLTGERAAL